MPPLKRGSTCTENQEGGSSLALPPGQRNSRRVRHSLCPGGGSRARMVIKPMSHKESSEDFSNAPRMESKTAWSSDVVRLQWPQKPLMDT